MIPLAAKRSTKAKAELAVWILHPTSNMPDMHAAELCT